MKAKLQTLWTYVKLYGGYVLMAVAVVVGFISYQHESDKFKNLLQQMQSQSESHRKEIEQLQQVQIAERQKHELIETTYRQVIDKIEKDEAQAVTDLDRKKRQQVRDIVTQTHDNPQEMASRINTLFGIPVYSPNSN